MSIDKLNDSFMKEWKDGAHPNHPRHERSVLCDLCMLDHPTVRAALDEAVAEKDEEIARLNARQDRYDRECARRVAEAVAEERRALREIVERKRTSADSGWTTRLVLCDLLAALAAREHTPQRTFKRSDCPLHEEESK
jgi:ATPase subunit of ABC transporter with duplicated ATPase domains